MKHLAESSQPVLIMGTRTFAVELADLISDINNLELVGFVENLERQKCLEQLIGFPIYWIDDLKDFAQTHLAVCGLGTTHRNKYVQEMAARGFSFVTVVHPSARVSSSSSVGAGTIVSAGAIIAAQTRLGEHVLVNRGALIGHHITTGSFVNIQSGANIGGNTVIGDGTYVGMGAVVINNLTIGSHSIIGAGAVVTRDVPDNVQVVGIPAKIVKENIDGL